MRSPIVLLICFGLTWVQPAWADDVDDVKAVVRAMYDALNNQDADGWAQTVFIPEDDTLIGSFPRAGGLRGEDQTTSTEQVRSGIQGSFGSGLRSNLTLNHLEAKVYGNTAIATYYTTGPFTPANGETLEGTFRASVTLIKQNGQWKQVHRHISRLVS